MTITAHLQVQIHLPQSQSLKDKRSVIKSLKERLRNQFNVSVAEVDDLDKWQVATLAIVMVSNDQVYLESQFEKIDQFIEQRIAGHGFVTFREMSLI